MNKKLLIIGAGGHGKVVADIALNLKKYDVIEFLDDAIKECMSFKVIDCVNNMNNYIEDYDIIVAIGNTSARKQILDELIKNNAKIPSLIHPTATIGENVEIGFGTVVMAGAIINPDSKIGNGCIINTAATVDHDCKLENYVHISVGAHLAGNVKIGESTWIGIGSSVINNINICENVMLGAGAVAVKDITESGTYIGVPAKKIK